MGGLAMAGRGLKEMARSGRLAAGTFLVEFVTPGIGHILAGAGCDFAFLDMEHSGFSEETVKAGLRFLEAGGIPTLVRVPSRDTHDIGRIADVGAEGVMVSLVGTAEVARAAVAALKYPPEGRRGVALRIAHDNYRPGATPAEALAAANARTTLFLMIETAEGVENVEAVAAVPGVDVLWVGHFDLSASLGIPGEFDHPRFRAATARICAAARAKGLGLGRLVTGAAEAEQAWRDGFRMLAWGGDAWLLQAAVAEGVAGLRRMAAAPAS
jgi:2-dehydro-3-deoxyglucarate aldolase/4-hydroxy-2-oxoheptanedioate aldolase